MADRNGAGCQNCRQLVNKLESAEEIHWAIISADDRVLCAAVVVVVDLRPTMAASERASTNKWKHPSSLQSRTNRYIADELQPVAGFALGAHSSENAKFHAALEQIIQASD